MRRKRLLEPFVYFVDECLGRHVVPDAIREAIDPEERVVLLDQGTLDTDWLPRAGEGGWICFTKDRALRRRPNELEALLRTPAAFFMLGEASGPAHAERIVAALPVVRRIARVRAVPLIARIEPEGTALVVYEGGLRLATPRRVRSKRTQT